MLTQNEDQKVEEKGRKGEEEKGRSAWQLAVYK